MTEMTEQKEKIVKLGIHKHESFPLRKGWLHKGIRNVKKDDRLFTRSDSDNSNKACDTLGIGVNMVKSLRYWLKATRLMLDINGKQTITTIGDIINENDPYFEEKGTNYIIHYLLASNFEEATAWYWFFNEHKGAIIDEQTFVEDFAEYCKVVGNTDTASAERVLKSEFSCLRRTYYGKDDDAYFDPEETKICPLTELRLIAPLDSKSKEFKKMLPDKDDIHPLIAYAIICKRQEELKSEQIQISELLNGNNNIGKIFNLDRSTVFYLIEKMEQSGLISIVRTAGLDVINIKLKMTFEECLMEYYARLGEVRND